MKKQLLGVNITIDAKDHILEEIDAYIRHKGEDHKKTPFIVVTPNPEQVMLAQSFPLFLKLLNRADTALPDGTGLVWAMKRNKGIHMKRIAGVDFMQELVHMAHKNGWNIALLGGWGTTAQDALGVLKTTYTRLIGWSETLPEVTVVGDVLTGIKDEAIRSLAKKIITSQTKCVFIGLGAPKQEMFIDLLAEELRKESYHAVLMAVGGSFDMIAGETKRAPIWVRNMGIEWLYRLIKEPWRWKRQLALIQFLFRVLKK